jgi:hypothetical protein
MMAILRRYVIGILVCILLFFSIDPIFAIENNNVKPEMFPDNFDKEYVVDDIIKSMNETYRGESGIETTERDIDLSKSYKIYDGSAIHQLKSTDYIELIDMMEKNQSYCYDVMIYDKDATYVAYLSFIQPQSLDARIGLTKEQIEEYEHRVGKWAVSGVGKYDEEAPFIDYYELAARVSGNNKDSL